VDLGVLGKSVQRLRLPCYKPAPPVKPSPEHVRLLAPLLEAHAAALARLQLCLDVESIVQTFSPRAKLVGELQGVRAHAVELSTLSPDQDPRSQFDEFEPELIQVPEDLRRLKDHVQSLTVLSSRLMSVPE